MNEDNLADVQAEIEGPVGTPYEGGLFRMHLVIGPEFPAAPPKGYFSTKIFHPNVSSEGEICVNVLKKDWKVRYAANFFFLDINFHKFSNVDKFLIL